MEEVFLFNRLQSHEDGATIGRGNQRPPYVVTHLARSCLSRLEATVMRAELTLHLTILSSLSKQSLAHGVSPSLIYFGAQFVCCLSIAASSVCDIVQEIIA